MSNESIENKTVNISLKMLWTVVISLLIGSSSIAGLYFGFIGKLNEMTAEYRESKIIQNGKDQLQDMQMENIKLNAQKHEIDLKELKKQLEQK